MVVVYTNLTNPLNQVVLSVSQTYFQFSVQACDTAEVRLTKVPGQTGSEAYQLTIGRYAEGIMETMLVNLDTNVSVWKLFMC